MFSSSTSAGPTTRGMTYPPVGRRLPNIVDLSMMEIRKLLHRPMVWVIFALPVVIGIAYFPIAYVTARAQGTLASLGPHLFPPGYIDGTFGLLVWLGPICVAVLAAGLIGSDYGWGTMRVQVAAGVPRAQLISAKLVALAVVVAAWIVASFGAASLSAVAVTLLSSHPLSFGHIDATWWGEFGLMFGRTWLLLVAWMSIAVGAAVVGRSLAAGIAVPIVLQVLENILANLAGVAGTVGSWINGGLLTSAAQSYEVHNVFGPVKSIPGTLTQPHATIVIVFYAVITLVAALVIFIRRDFTANA